MDFLDLHYKSFKQVRNPANFISGSNGLLQISSSNFSISTAGNVTMSEQVLDKIQEKAFWSVEQPQLIHPYGFPHAMQDAMKLTESDEELLDAANRLTSTTDAKDLSQCVQKCCLLC